MEQLQFNSVDKMRWTVFLISCIFLCLALSNADQYDPHTYSDLQQPHVLYHRQDFGTIIDGNPLGLIGVGAVVGIIAGGVAVAKAANERTTIQNNINTLSTTTSNLQTTTNTVTGTLTTAQMTTAENDVKADSICTFLNTAGAVTVADNADALNEIIAAAMAVSC